MRHGSVRSSGPQPPEPAFYAWKVPGQALSIELNLAILDRLTDEVMKGFWAVPKRGAEVGGILLGTLIPSAVPRIIVEDFEPVACEHRRGPSYVLSEPDRRRMERALRRAGSRVVGFYRSHTRLGLYLDQDDDALIRSCFANPNHAFLLMRPGASQPPTAGFFFWEDGEIRRHATYREFTFNRAAMLKEMGAEPPEAEPEPAHIEAAAAPLERASAAPAPAPKPRQRVLNLNPVLRGLRQGPWRKAAFAAALLAGFGLMEYEALNAFGKHSEPAGVEASPPLLSVERNGSSLRLNWNHRAPAVIQAGRGVLTIADGARRRRIELDTRQLRTGSVAYFPIGGDVSFRLELEGTGPAVGESLRVLNGGSLAAQAPSTVAVRPAPGKAAVAIAPPGPPPAPRLAVAPQPAPVVRAAAVDAKPHARPRHPWVDDGL